MGVEELWPNPPNTASPSEAAQFGASSDAIEVPVSAIEHYSYCPRQCALIHVEQTYEENLFTIRGKLAHARVDELDVGSKRGIAVHRGIPLWSDKYGLRGRADVVEMHPSGPYPIEYKVGSSRGPHANLQLCAQAICLAEMTGSAVPEGAVYHAATRRRDEVVFDDELKNRTLEIVVAIRAMLFHQRVPEAPNDSRCPNCSLFAVCLPRVVAERRRLGEIQAELFKAHQSP
jgi:CRISPR-associated exonuclease Cas4